MVSVGLLWQSTHCSRIQCESTIVRSGLCVYGVLHFVWTVISAGNCWVFYLSHPSLRGTHEKGVILSLSELSCMLLWTILFVWPIAQLHYFCCYGKPCLLGPLLNFTICVIMDNPVCQAHCSTSLEHPFARWNWRLFWHIIFLFIIFISVFFSHLWITVQY
jgi:hypothetical protein